jgi:hypothetical protein
MSGFQRWQPVLPPNNAALEKQKGAEQSEIEEHPIARCNCTDMVARDVFNALIEKAPFSSDFCYWCK